jgi:tRNA modification GTPase
MKLDLQRTIVAISSGSMPGRRAIVRLSGSLTRSILSQLFVGADDQRLLAHTVPWAARVLCSLAWPGRDSLSKVPAFAYYWPDSRSFTGEPCAELHLVGCVPIVEALVAHLCRLGADPAERGEFTLRSFLAGKVDLVQAEAVLGVIEAEGPAQLHEALSQLGGNLSKPVRGLRSQLIELIAHLEAGLDFVEEDIVFIRDEELILQLSGISQHLTALSEQFSTRDARSQSAQIVLVGLPNSGKSSLFNCLIGSERAIVSPLAGTTRDVIGQSVDLAGMTVELIDTAGIEELQGDSPRAEAQVALKRRLMQADIAVLCIDTSQPLDAAWLAAQVQMLVQLGVSIVTVGTKLDLPPSANLLQKSQPALDVLVSVRTGAGISELRNRLVGMVASHRTEFQSAAMQHIAVRCRQSLDAAAATIHRAIALADSGEGEELVAAELRMALDDLSAVIGEVHSDDILGEIFSRFCIGK